MPLIERLFEEPLDVIGDIHGEIDALNKLLLELGYDPDGNHPDKRRLVFVGDLVDRGPDSPAVIDRVEKLVATGKAQCVLGNHELNLLRDSKKNDNHWWMDPNGSSDYPAAIATEPFKTRAYKFLSSLPLALERDDLRVVHACWHAESIDAIRNASGSVADVFERHSKKLKKELADDGIKARSDNEKEKYRHQLHDRGWTPQYLSALAEYDESYQMRNPIRVITSGQEGKTNSPFWASGKWRMLQRRRWWRHYNDHQVVIIGHYWRKADPLIKQIADKKGPDLFENQPPATWMGKRNNVYCIDFSVGGRCHERSNGMEKNDCKLAALRVPDWTVVFDDGETWQLPTPG